MHVHTYARTHAHMNAHVSTCKHTFQYMFVTILKRTDTTEF